jgi:hypothetical protein
MKLSGVAVPCLMLLLPVLVPDARGDDNAPPRSPEEVRAAVGALHVEEVPWRKVEWRTCLLEGLNESREAGKPVILWIFIDRPIDDERC